jgi:hypothetical protein
VDTRAVPKEVSKLDRFFARSRPDVVATHTADGRARIRAVVDAAAFSKSKPHQVLVVTQAPTTFRLERQGGSWKLADTAYLKQRYRIEILGK